MLHVEWDVKLYTLTNSAYLFKFLLCFHHKNHWEVIQLYHAVLCKCVVWHDCSQCSVCLSVSLSVTLVNRNSMSNCSKDHQTFPLPGISLILTFHTVKYRLDIKSYGLHSSTVWAISLNK